MYGGEYRNGGWRKLPPERWGCMKGVPGELEAAQAEAADLYSTIVMRIGMEEAKEIFGNLAKPLSKEQHRELQNTVLIDLYSHMLDIARRRNIPWSVHEMARFVAQLNSLLPTDARMGPRGSTAHATLDKHLRRLLARRRRAKASQ